MLQKHDSFAISRQKTVRKKGARECRDLSWLVSIIAECSSSRLVL